MTCTIAHTLYSSPARPQACYRMLCRKRDVCEPTCGNRQPPICAKRCAAAGVHGLQQTAHNWTRMWVPVQLCTVHEVACTLCCATWPCYKHVLEEGKKQPQKGKKYITRTSARVSSSRYSQARSYSACAGSTMQARQRYKTVQHYN